MFIKNQTFSDRDTLLETLFDFELGDHTQALQKMMFAIDQTLQTDTEYQEELKSLMDEEDRDEFADEVRREFLANMLHEQFSRFEVKDRKWYGVSTTGEAVLLAEMDLV